MTRRPWSTRRRTDGKQADRGAGGHDAGGQGEPGARRGPWPGRAGRAAASRAAGPGHGARCDLPPDHRPAPGRRPSFLRGHRQGRGPERGRGPPARAAPAGQRRHADRRGDRPDVARLPPAGDDRSPVQRRPAADRRRARGYGCDRLRRDHGRLVRPADRGRLRRRRRAARHPRAGALAAGRDGDGGLRVPEAAQADLPLGDQMSESDQTGPDSLQRAAKRNLWLHFTRMSAYRDADVPVIVRGSGEYVYDQRGKRYLDGLAGLFVSQIGHGRAEVAQAGARQAAELAYFPLWSYAHPRAIELAERLADLAPGDLNRVFFTTSGSEAVESAWKLAKQYFAATGQPGRYKVLSRAIAYHGTSMGALAITGLPDIKAPFEPLPPGGVRVPNTNFYRAPGFVADDWTAFGRWAADEIERAILREGPESVAAVFLEPVQNSGGCFPPPPGYFARVREICDRYGVLLVSDEVICAFGRLGHYFGSQRYGYQPDIITFAKGVTSGYAPLGGMLVRDALMEPFNRGTATFLHGITFAGHPVSAAVALANLDVFEKEDLLGNVRANEGAFRSTLEKLNDLPIVGDIRGDGYFYGIELVKDKDTRATFTDEESERLLRGFLSTALFDAGLVCRADDRGDPVIQLAPPLICTQEHFDEMEQILRTVLTEAWERL